MDYVDEMIDANKSSGFQDVLTNTTLLEDAILLLRGTEQFVSEVMLHRHGAVVRLSFYANHQPRPICSIAMSEGGLTSLATLLADSISDARIIEVIRRDFKENGQTRLLLGKL